MGTIVAGIIVAGVAGLAVYSMVRGRKNGKSIQCNGVCLHCKGLCRQSAAEKSDRI